MTVQEVLAKGYEVHCGTGSWPETPTTGWCCEGSAYRGAEGCLCWEPVFDLVQNLELQTEAATEIRPMMCGDCAFKPGSPERTGDPQALGTPELLAALVATDQPFWCHQGMRLPTEWRHPSGATVPGSGLDYKPPIVDGRPYRADGTPGEVCAGWAARWLAKA